MLGASESRSGSVTGNTIASINEVPDRYTKLTADRAGAVLARRLAHENGCPARTLRP
jgi:hypothetical protein